ncbi:comm domain-containing protein [Anaeramoeba ignava]|uniref:Comm domain-containing protein n=1 Tax=Anaeramoeba ignava TaxID=1746090 RepID=A0A9Q0LT03_ANAIG|nr:comm domain-containing protein [Anaeramoeba ignava]|eukprot:Anaeramoba_ignava/a94173_6.p1 GENE.a94173_6~~a94173_6.p1  ORF type:complete len:200 (+),score=84.97 a94173_6:40-639(+)
MKFKFCGGLDAPDWLLAEIMTLSKMSSVKMKLLCVEVIHRILKQDTSYEKITKMTSNLENESDVKGAVAALHFILSSSAKFDVEPNIVSTELQQLGLPKEHCESLIRPYREQKEAIQAKFVEESLRLTKVKNVEWRSDYIISANKTEVQKPVIQLKLDLTDFSENSQNTKKISFEINDEKFKLLLNDLNEAKDLMKKFQ